MTTPLPVLDSVLRSVCGRGVGRLLPLTGGGLHETYRVEVRDHPPVVVRIARRTVPWFTDDARRGLRRPRGPGRPRGVRSSGRCGVERGAELLRDEVSTRPAPGRSLAHGDWLPKHLLIDDGAIVGVLDWEFAGPASPAFDLARWEISAGDVLHDRADLLRRGYARVADPAAASAGWVPAFAVDWALQVLAWQNPAPPARMRRCVDVIARYAGS